VLVALVVVASACNAQRIQQPPATEAAVAATPSSTPAARATAAPAAGAGTSDEATSEPRPEVAGARPAWLGTRVLPLRGDGFGQVLPTPRVLRDRRLVTPELLPPPPDDRFRSTVGRVPAAVLERSTWSGDCPVTRRELRYLTVSFWGFDERHHTGELLVHRDVADDLVTVFSRLHAARFPLEEMRVVDSPELDAPPTGDGNNTSAFVCRPSTGGGTWSEHAYGLAVDVNPFHNPYVRGDLVVPELASVYTDRDRMRPGMVTSGDTVTGAFEAIGWHWGGAWTSAKDWMHFSRSGR
jgi:hypothetical protein